MGAWMPRFALAWIAAVAATCVSVPAAGAATTTLRPDGNAASNGVWYADPWGAVEWAVLDEAVTQPTTPASGDWIYTDTDRKPDVRVNVQDRALGAGEVVTRTTAWAYIATHPSRSIRF